MGGVGLTYRASNPAPVSLAYVEKRRVEAPEISVRLRRETPTTWYGLIEPEMRYRSLQAPTPCEGYRSWLLIRGALNRVKTPWRRTTIPYVAIVYVVKYGPVTAEKGVQVCLAAPERKTWEFL